MHILTTETKKNSLVIVSIMWPKVEPEVTCQTRDLVCSQFKEIWSVSITI